jgi:hypothetical protein
MPMSPDKSSTFTFAHSLKFLRGVETKISRWIVSERGVIFGWRHLTSRDHLVPTVSRVWNEKSNGASIVGYLNRLASDDSRQISTGVLAKFSNSNTLHVLHGSTMRTI